MIKSTVFPFNFIPTTVEVTDDHVSINYRQIGWTRQQDLIPMKNIHSVEMDSDLFFAELRIIHGTPEHVLELPHFWKKDAQALRDAIEKILDKEERGI